MQRVVGGPNVLARFDPINEAFWVRQQVTGVVTRLRRTGLADRELSNQIVAFGFESGGARARIGLCQCGEQMPHGVTAQLGGRRFPAAHRRGAGGKAHVEPEHVQHPFRVKEVQIGLGAAPVVGEGAGQQSDRAEREREGGDSYFGR